VLYCVNSPVEEDEVSVLLSELKKLALDEQVLLAQARMPAVSAGEVTEAGFPGFLRDMFALPAAEGWRSRYSPCI
jgi:ribosomal protein L12E/L44/L45/RPP1/RPP2